MQYNRLGVGSLGVKLVRLLHQEPASRSVVERQIADAKTGAEIVRKLCKL